MKQAILITAYHKFDLLFRLIESFNSSFNIYIHIDRKSDISQHTLNSLLKFDTVKCIDRSYQVYWGGINHMHAYLKLSKVALDNPDNSFFHLITGQDIVCQPLESFQHFCSSQDNYLEWEPFPSQKYGGWERYNYYNLYDCINVRHGFNWVMNKYARLVQMVCGLKRTPLPGIVHIYSGSTYWSLTRNALQYVIDFSQQQPQLINRLKHTFCAEELYFQTVLLNSPFKETILNKNLRYIDWSSDREGPAILNESDVSDIIASSALFARKVDEKYGVKWSLNFDQC